MKLRNVLVWLVAAVWLPWALPAQEDAKSFGPKPSAGAKAKAQYEANLAAHKGQPDKLVLPGLVADRKARTVAVLAESTGLKEGDLAEFLLVDQMSDRGYEALLWSYAKPSDVHRALEFIGLKTGAPFNPAELRFSPDGDKVILTVQTSTNESYPIERLILDTEANATLPEKGFVFAGSVRTPRPDAPGQLVYVADEDDVRSVASLFNDPCTVLDVPREVNKGEAYGKQVVNPELALEGGQLVTVMMTPGIQRSDRHLLLSIEAAAVSTNGTVFRLSEAGGAALYTETTFTALLERLVAMGKEEAKVCVALSFGKGMPLQDVKKICVVMVMMETMKSIRLEPPANGQLYYRAFMPDKDWATAPGRPSLSWELHLSRNEGRIAGRMVWHEKVWAENQTTPTYKAVTNEVANPEAVRLRLAGDKAWVPSPGGLLVYAPSGLNYGEMIEWVGPVLTMGKPVYIFIKD